MSNVTCEKILLNYERMKVMATAKDKNEIWEWIKALFIAIILVLIIRTFLFTPIVVEGSSMEPTL